MERKRIKSFFTTMIALVMLLFYSISCAGSVVNEEIDINPSDEKSFAVLGNSISTYFGTMPPGYTFYYSSKRLSKQEMWWSLLAQKTNTSMIANSSWSGATVAYVQSLDSLSFFYSDFRITSLARNGVPDAIFVLGGTNDWARSIPLGNSEETNKDQVTTFYGSYSLMVRKLKNHYPNSMIFLCGILPRKEGGNARNRSGWTIKQGNNAIREIAERYKVVYIDMDDCGMAHDIQNCTFDGLHPNQWGMAMVADKIIEMAQNSKPFIF